jgi:hypothetical protein
MTTTSTSVSYNSDVVGEVECEECARPIVVIEAHGYYQHGAGAAWAAPGMDLEVAALTCPGSLGGPHEPMHAPGRVHADVLIARSLELMYRAAVLDPDRCPPACAMDGAHTFEQPCAFAGRRPINDPKTITGPVTLADGSMTVLQTKVIRVSAKPTEHLR